MNPNDQDGPFLFYVIAFEIGLIILAIINYFPEIFKVVYILSATKP